ncbi:MAG: glycosyltransferase [Vicinamibacterales bacterium]
MRVAFVHWVIDPVLGAGMAVKTVNVSRALAAAGADVRVVTTDAGLDARAAPMPGVDVVVLPARGRRFPVPRAPGGTMASLVGDRDVVFLMNHWTAINAMAVRACWRARVPYGICPGGALRIQGRSRALKQVYQWMIGHRLLRDASVVLATTPLEGRQFETDGIPPARIAVIPNGVDVEPAGATAAAFRARHLPGDAPFVLFMGRLNPIKGPDLLLDAFARVARARPGWQLVFAGRDEGMEAGLRDRAAALDLADRVRFVGHLDAAMSVGAYRAAALLAVPSRHEAMSQVALEAAVVGTPVLLTDACGFDEVGRVGGGGVVAPTVDAIAQGLDDLIARPDALPAMGDALRTFVAGEYGWPGITRRYLDLFDRMRARGRATG